MEYKEENKEKNKEIEDVSGNLCDPEVFQKRKQKVFRYHLD